MIESRKIEELNPILQVLTKRFLEIAEEQKIKVGVGGTYRDKEQQNYYYDVTKTTTVKGGYSYHNWGLAVDIVPLDDKGNLIWPVTKDPIWKKLGEIGKSLGMEWGGEWKDFIDMPHYQITYGYACSSFVKGVKVPTVIKQGCSDVNLVKFIQEILGVKPDGIFGQLTKQAVTKYNSTGEITSDVLDKMIKDSKQPKTKFIIDGKEILAHTQIVGDYNYVKVRDLLEPMGYEVSVDEGKKAIVATKNI